MKIDIKQRLNSQMSDIVEDCKDIVQAVAGRYFQERFVEKAFDRKPWKPNKNPARRGSELVLTGNLRNSFHAEKTARGVMFSFGAKPKVDYAKVHNEGFDGEVTIPAHVRNTKRGPQQVREYKHESISAPTPPLPCR